MPRYVQPTSSRVTITVAGTHTLRVDANGSGTGSFSTTIQRLNDPTPCPAINFDPPGWPARSMRAAEIDCRSRAGAVGQSWRIRLVETDGTATLIHEVVRPDGTTVCAPTGAVESSCLLDAAGTHRIIVTDNSGTQTGDYRLVLEKFPAPVGCTALTFGAPVTATVNNPGELSCFTFAGANADQIRIRAVLDERRLEPGDRGLSRRRHARSAPTPSAISSPAR